MKRCSKCGESKPLDEFSPHAKAPDGKQAQCRECRRVAQAAYYARNRDAIHERAARGRRENPDRQRQYGRSYWASLTPEQRAHKREVRKAWYAANAEARREYQRAYMESHPEAREANRRAVVAWEKRNPLRARDKHARRRALVGDGKVTLAEWEALLAREGGHCAYCNTRPEALTMDHVVPLSRGGKHAIENILPACKSCNSRKGARTPGEWFGLVA